MQSVVTLQLRLPRHSLTSCVSPSATDGISPSPLRVLSPIPGSAGSASATTTLLYPPPHLLSQEWQPRAIQEEAKPQAVYLNLKRQVLSRPRVPLAPIITSGSPSEVVELPQSPTTTIGAKDSLPSLPEIDMQQFKSVKLAPPPSNSHTLHKVYVEFYPNHIYKLKCGSAKEAQVWVDIFSAYGEYKEYGGGGSSNGGDLNSHSPTATQTQTQSQNTPPLSGPDSFPPYYAYSIPTLYAKALESCFAYLRLHRGYRREGLFRTGKSSSAILKSILLNQGRILGGDWAKLKDEVVGQPKLDLHVLAFTAKNLLRSLPETLLTNALMQKIFDAAKCEDVPTLIQLLQFLPPVNYHLLQLLFELLFLTSKEPTSRMTVESLSKVVGPNLLPKDDSLWIRGMTQTTEVTDGANLKRSSFVGASHPLPGSIPIMQLFELIFLHGKEIFPQSEVFRTGGTPASTNSKLLLRPPLSDKLDLPLQGSALNGTVILHTGLSKPIPAHSAPSSTSTTSSSSSSSSSASTSPLVLPATTQAAAASSLLPPVVVAPTDSTTAPAPMHVHVVDDSISHNTQSHTRLDSLESSSGTAIAGFQLHYLPGSISSTPRSGTPTTVGHSRLGRSNGGNGASTEMITVGGGGGSSPFLTTTRIGTHHRRRTSDYEREVEREVVLHAFPRFHQEDEE